MLCQKLSDSLSWFKNAKAAEHEVQSDSSGSANPRLTCLGFADPLESDWTSSDVWIINAEINA